MGYTTGGDNWDSASIGLCLSASFGLFFAISCFISFCVLHLKLPQVYFIRTFFPPQHSRSTFPPSSARWFTWIFNPTYDNHPANILYGPSYPWERLPGNHRYQVFLNDEQLHLRTLGLMLRIAIIWTVYGLLTGLPCYLVGIPQVGGKTSTIKEGIIGHFSSLDQINLLRLIRAYDIENGVNAVATDLAETDAFRVKGLSAKNRLILLTVLTLTIPIILTLYMLKVELDLLIRNNKQFLEIYCKRLEIGFLGVNAWELGWLWGVNRKKKKKIYQLKGMSDIKLRELLVICGLGPDEEESSQSKGKGGGKERERKRKESGFGWMARRLGEVVVPDSSTNQSRSKFKDLAIAYGASGDQESTTKDIAVEGVYVVGDVSELENLEKKRRKVVDDLEVAEARYISSFQFTKPAPSDGASQDIPYFSVRSKSVGKRRDPSSSNPPLEVIPYGPSLYYSLHPNPPLERSNSRRYLEDTEASLSTISTTFKRKLHGATFTEVDIDLDHSVAQPKFPLGSQIRVNAIGQFEPVTPMDPTLYQPRGVVTVAAELNQHDESVLAYPPVSFSSIHSSEDMSFSSLNSERTERGRKSIAIQPLQPSLEVDNTLSSIESGELSRNRSINFASTPTIEPRREQSSNRNSLGRSGQGNSKSTVTLQPAPPHFRQYVQPVPTATPTFLGDLYTSIRELRSRLKKLNVEIQEKQKQLANDLEEGKDVSGWILVGRGVHHFKGIQMVEGFCKEDIMYHSLNSPTLGSVGFCIGCVLVGIVSAAILVPAAALSVLTQPGVANTFTWLQEIFEYDECSIGILTTLIPALIVACALQFATMLVGYLTAKTNSASRTSNRLNFFKGLFALIFIIEVSWFIGLAAVIFASNNVESKSRIARNIAEGAIASSALYFSLYLVFLGVPGVILFRPWTLLHSWRKLQKVVTPRQMFQALRPKDLSPSLCTIMVSFVLIAFSFFFTIAPILGLPVLILLLLVIISQRFNVAHVYIQSSQSGGRFALLTISYISLAVCTQPLLLGLIALSRDQWALSTACFGVSALVLATTRFYYRYATIRPRTRDLNPTTLAGLRAFQDGARELENVGDIELLGSSAAADSVVELSGNSARGSMVSILDILNLLDTPYPNAETSTIKRTPRAVPIPTEEIRDDYNQSKLVARTHPFAPPHLPPLPFTTQDDPLAREMLYNPVLTTKPPVLIFPRDTIAREEASDCKKYWGLEAVYEDAVALSSLPGLRAPPRPPGYDNLDVTLPSLHPSPPSKS